MRLEIKKQSTMTGTNRNRRRLPFSRTVKNNTQCNYGRKPSKYKEYCLTKKRRHSNQLETWVRRNKNNTIW
jgi:hypothetical protein